MCRKTKTYLLCANTNRVGMYGKPSLFPKLTTTATRIVYRNDGNDALCTFVTVTRVHKMSVDHRIITGIRWSFFRNILDQSIRSVDVTNQSLSSMRRNPTAEIIWTFQNFREVKNNLISCNQTQGQKVTVGVSTRLSMDFRTKAHVHFDYDFVSSNQLARFFVGFFSRHKSEKKIVVRVQ